MGILQYAVLHKVVMFRVNVLPTSSESKCKSSEQQPEITLRVTCVPYSSTLKIGQYIPPKQ
jgi:hypothetical protein